MQQREEDEEGDQESEFYRFSFQLLIPNFGGDEDGPLEGVENGRAVHILRFQDQPQPLFQGQGDAPSFSAGNPSSRVRSLRPTRERTERTARRQEEHDNFIMHLQENAPMFAAIALRQFLRDMEGVMPHLQGQPPAAQESINQLPILHCLTEKRRLKHRICSICQDDFKPPPISTTSDPTLRQDDTSTNSTADNDDQYNPDDIIRMPCHHIFHRNCLTPWLKERSATCPTCRYEIFTDNEDYNQGIRERMKERDEKLKLEPDTDTEDEPCLSTDITPVHAAPSSSKDMSPLSHTCLNSNDENKGGVSTRRKRRRLEEESRPAESLVHIPDLQAPPALRRSKRLQRAPSK